MQTEAELWLRSFMAAKWPHQKELDLLQVGDRKKCSTPSRIQVEKTGEPRFFVVVFLNGLNAFLGPPSASQSCFLPLNELFLVLSSNSTVGAALCRPLHLYRVYHLLQKFSIVNGCGDSFRCGTATSARSLCSPPLLIWRSGWGRRGRKKLPVRRFGTNSRLLRSHFFTVTSTGSWCVCGLDSLWSWSYLDFTLTIFPFGRNELCAGLSPCKLTANRFTGDINLICHLIFKVKSEMNLVGCSWAGKMKIL